MDTTIAPSSPDDRLIALHEQLVDQVRALRTGADWTAWLRLAARLHTYSFNNVLLIARQRPDAATVAGYRAWQELGRQVDKGEHGIRILAPVTRRADPAVEPHEDGDDADVRAVVGYRVGYVWDVSQTHGRPLPERPHPVLLPGQAPSGLWDALEAQVRGRGLTVSRGDCGGANGVTDFAARTVRVRGDVDDAHAVKTLAHELGHVLLHDGDGRLDCRGVVEVEAESFAYLITAHHGLVSDTYTFPYVLTWAATVPGDEPEAVVRNVGQRVVDAAHKALAPVARISTVARGEARDVSRVDDRRTPAGQLTSPTEPLVAIHEDAAAFFADGLATSWVPAHLDSRRLGDALAADAPWHIGYAPAAWTGLVDRLRELGYGEDTISESGLAIRARTGHLIDRFRDRLTLAVRREDGHVVGFVCRARPDTNAGSPKYLNSPSTPIFRKSEQLFGLYESLQTSPSNATPVMTEGPLDAIAVALAAPDRAPVALCGTALTNDHIAAITRTWTSPLLVMALDADTAGSESTRRAYTALRAHGLTPMLADLPPGNDPADVLQAHGTARLADAVGPRTTPLVERLIELRIGDFDDQMRWVEGRVAAVRAVAPPLRDCDASHRHTLARRVAEWTGVDLSTVLHELHPAMPGAGATAAAPTRTTRTR